MTKLSWIALCDVDVHPIKNKKYFILAHGMGGTLKSDIDYFDETLLLEYTLNAEQENISWRER